MNVTGGADTMLRETPRVRQIPGAGTMRRWFSNECFDLIVWQRGTEIAGFQLCYDVHAREHALTWHERWGYSHNRIDTGRNGRHPESPILVAAGPFPAARVVAEFLRDSAAIDPRVVRFVREKLQPLLAAGETGPSRPG